MRVGISAAEGRWTVPAGVGGSVPDRFGARGPADFADELPSTSGYGFSGHEDNPAAPKRGA
jgi:hypothetical protein